jgi:hypothetical protein
MPRTQDYRDPLVDHGWFLCSHHDPYRHGCHEEAEGESGKGRDEAAAEGMVEALGVQALWKGYGYWWCRACDEREDSSDCLRSECDEMILVRRATQVAGLTWVM